VSVAAGVVVDDVSVDGVVAEPLSVGAVVVVVDGSVTANASCAVDNGTMSASAAPAQIFRQRRRRSARDVGGTPERAARADERVEREPKVPAMVPCPALSLLRSELPSRNASRMGRSHHWLAPGFGDRTTPGGHCLPLPLREIVGIDHGECKRGDHGA
jgi:hypothetical protein